MDWVERDAREGHKIGKKYFRFYRDSPSCLFFQLSLIYPASDAFSLKMEKPYHELTEHYALATKHGKCNHKLHSI